MSFNYKNPISPLLVLGNSSVARSEIFGTNFSVLSTGGYMEVYSLSDLLFTIPPSTTGLVEFSGNTIPIQLNIGTGSVFSPNVLTLNSDNISSGRRKIGMLVYVINEDQIYQYQIPNFETLWSNATGATGPGGNTVIFSDFGTTIKSNTLQGISFINAWTANTIEGIGGETSSTAVWKKFVTGSNFTGGTVTNPTNFTNGLSANTFSATTYLGLPADFNTFVTAYTYNNNTFRIFDNSGNTFSAVINNVTGLTVNGILSATTYQNLPKDIFVTGGTFTGGSIIFTNNSGGTFNVSGISSFDTFVTGFSYNNNVLTISQNSGSPLSVTINTFTGLTANTISATTYQNLPPSVDTFTTAFTYNNNTFTISRNQGQPNLTATINTVTGLTVNGGLSATTISATTYQNLPTDVRVTGATYNNNTFTFTNNTGGTFNVSFNTVTGLTVNGNLTVTGNTNVRGITGTTGLFSSNTQNVFTIYGSGNTFPVFVVQGSSGELFSVTDSLIGSLFSVNDISGLPVFEVFSDNTILMGSYLAPSLNTTVKLTLTAGTNNIYSIPMSAYTGAFTEYTLLSSTSARSGYMMGVFSGSSVQFNETTTLDIGNTSAITMSYIVSGNNAILTASATTSGFTIKSIIRSI